MKRSLFCFIWSIFPRQWYCCNSKVSFWQLCCWQWNSSRLPWEEGILFVQPM